MNYVIADIHGCYKAYVNLLEKCSFSDEDTLYVLGDVVDRGPEPLSVLKDLMQRFNAVLILGNHEYMMYKVLKKLSVKITKENAADHLSSEDLMNYSFWLSDGGQTTAEQFRLLSEDEQQDMLSYIEEASLFEDIEIDGKRYILVHAGLSNFDEKRPLDDYGIEELLFSRIDYGRRYYPDENVYIVTGHSPVMEIREDKKAEIYRENGHIAIDCGCVFGGKLALYCLDTDEVYYESI